MRDHTEAFDVVAEHMPVDFEAVCRQSRIDLVTVSHTREKMGRHSWGRRLATEEC